MIIVRLVDTPTNEMHTDAFVEEAIKVVEELKEFGVTYTQIRGEELRSALD